MTIDIDGPEGPEYDRAYWWAPLERVAELVRDDPEFAELDLDDFMVMCGYNRSGGHVIEYKHIHTRRCITLADDTAVVDSSVRDALLRLELRLGAEMKRNLMAWADEVEAGGTDGRL